MFHRPPPGAEVYRAGCAKAADGMRVAGGFGDPEDWQFGWDRDYSRDEWLDLLPTFGFHNQLPQDRLQQVLAGVGAAIDAAGGGFTMHYATVVLTAASTAAP